MSQVTMQSLFAAAREDAPDDTTHDAMWSGIADATGIAATATAAATAAGAAKPAAAAVASATGSKLLIIGAFIGAVSAAIGGVVALGWMEAETGVAPAASAAAPVARAVHLPSRGATLADPRPRLRDPENVDRLTRNVNVNVNENVNAAPQVVAAGGLAEETRIVTDARAAIVAGDPARALALLRTTHRFTTRALEPEEMSLEARALRALGRIDEAAATELTLKSRFPSHALAR